MNQKNKDRLIDFLEDLQEVLDKHKVDLDPTYDSSCYYNNWNGMELYFKSDYELDRESFNYDIGTSIEAVGINYYLEKLNDS